MPTPSFVRRLPLVALVALAGWTSPAPDVVVDCDPSLAPALHMLAGTFRASHDVEVHIFTGPGSRLAGLIVHRARADIVVTEPATLDTLHAAGLLVAGSRVVLGADPYVLIAPAALAPAGTAAATLARYRAVVTDDTTAASFDGQALLKTAAAGGAMAGPATGVATEADVADAVGQASDEVGLVRATDANASDGTASGAVKIAAKLAVAPARIEAALTRNGQSGQAAAFLAFATGPAAQVVWRRAGLEPAS